MRVVLTYSRDGTTITATLLPKRERWPPIKKITVEHNTTYAIPAALFGDRIAIGPIPPEYKYMGADKYEIIFKNNRAPKERRKR